MNKKKPASPIKSKVSVLDMQDYLKARDERNYVLFTLGVSTGYRAGDLVELKVRDVRKALKDNYFEILEGKKRNSKNIKKKNLKPRKVKINSALEGILREYIDGRMDYEYVFESRKGINQHISVSSFSRILKSAGKELGFKNVSAHTMRKTYAYYIYVNSEHNLTLVKEMLGHSFEDETRRYIGIDEETYDKYNDMLDDLIMN